MAESLGVTINDVFQTLQTYLGSTYVNLFNKFNQSFQVRVQGERGLPARVAAISPICTSPTVRVRWCRWARCSTCGAMLGSELITRYNLYPAAPLIGAPPGYSSGQALRHHGADRRPDICRWEWITTGPGCPTRRS